MASSGKKVVQIELDSREYELLSLFARQQGLTIKEAARKAIMESSFSRIDLKNDPFLRMKPVPFKTRVKNSEIDRVLYIGKR